MLTPFPVTLMYGNLFSHSVPRVKTEICVHVCVDVCVCVGVGVGVGLCRMYDRVQYRTIYIIYA